MKKVIDVDKIFEGYMRRYVAANKGKYTEQEWYDKLPEIYSSFENTAFDELDGATPLTYYAGEKDLVPVLKSYVDSGVPLNDYLLDEIVKSVPEEKVIELLDEDADEQLLLSAIDVLRKKNAKNAVNRYIDLLFSKKICHHVKDEMAEDVIVEVDLTAEKLLARLEDEKNVPSMFAEILSNSSKKDERIKKLLLSGLKKGDKVPEYAVYLTNYGDESCLDEMISYLDTLTDYVSYKELKIAIEALGGDVKCDKDFSDDKNFIRIKAAANDRDKNQ